jgi:hypothetical protein
VPQWTQNVQVIGGREHVFCLQVNALVDPQHHLQSPQWKEAQLHPCTPVAACAASAQPAVPRHLRNPSEAFHLQSTPRDSQRIEGVPGSERSGKQAHHEYEEPSLLRSYVPEHIRYDC